jgi:[ribosomal protein S18]-alanine N-acetyltransferase
VNAPAGDEVVTATTVRPATPADAPAIQAIEGLSASTLRLLDHDLALADRRCLVATADPDGRVVAGYAAAILQDTDAHVIDIAVAPAARRQGIGRQLLEALVDAVLAAGARAVTLEVRASNLGSQALYRQAGFVDEGRRPGYYPDGEDALIWWLRPDVEEVD